MKFIEKVKSAISQLALCAFILFAAFEAPYVHKKYIRNIAEESTVQLYGEKGTGSGSHVVFNDKTVILTNRHVCELADSKGNIEVERVDGSRIKRKVIKKDSKHDLCIVEAIPNVEGLSLANSMDIGETIYTLGHPRGDKLNVASGEYFANETIQLEKGFEEDGSCKGKIEKIDFFFLQIDLCTDFFESVQFSTPTYPGNSGSPIVNKYGNLVAVVFAGNPQVENMGFGVPLSYVKDFLSKNLK